MDVLKRFVIIYIVIKIYFAKIVTKYLYIILSILEYNNCQNEQIIKDLLKINIEMNEKCDTYDNLENLICIEDENIVDIEKKLDNCSINTEYNYASNLLNKNISLPKLNIDLSKLIIYFKNNKDSADDLVKEITSINNYLNKIIKRVNLSKNETLKEKSIIYYLFYFVSRCFYYIILHNNFIVSQKNSKIFTNFFDNFLKIINSVKIYYENDIKDSYMMIEEKNMNKIIEDNINKGIYNAFNEIINYPNELQQIILKSQNVISVLLFTVEENIKIDDEDEEINFIDTDIYNLLEKFIVSFDIIQKINEYYSILDYKLFYNDTISKTINKKREIRIFLNNIKNKSNKKYNIEFTTLDYMWLYNPTGKKDIINLFNIKKRDNENEKDSFFRSKLYLEIRRSHLIEDTLNEISSKDTNFHSELKIKFKGEKGVDVGGVKKEFFLLLIRQIFDPNYGMFSYNKKTRLFWFNHYSFEPEIKFELIGIIFGLAIYNNNILDVKLPLAAYKKLLGIKPTLEDMKEIDPDLYQSLIFLKNTKNENLEKDLDTNFTVLDEKFGEKILIELKENGENIMININNKDEYIELYLDWYFNKSINNFYNRFEKGFYLVFDKNLAKNLKPDELELIICGTQFLDFNELKNACKYRGYKKDSETIKYLWEVLLEFNEEEKKKFLFFVTGCDRAPIEGLGSLEIVITNEGEESDLPMAHTCFNNLVLPDYKNFEKTKKNILIAINYSEGFGLE